MSKVRTIRPEEYRDLGPYLYHTVIPNYYWLSADGSVCYRFMSTISEVGRTEGRLAILRASDPAEISFDERYSIEYSIDNLTFIHFLGESYTISAIKIHYSDLFAAILHLEASDGHVMRLFAAISNPFSDNHKEVYGV